MLHTQTTSTQIWNACSFQKNLGSIILVTFLFTMSPTLNGCVMTDFPNLMEQAQRVRFGSWLWWLRWRWQIEWNEWRRNWSGQIIIFHQPGFPWNKGISLTKPPFGVRSCEVAIIWPDWWRNIMMKKNMMNINHNTMMNASWTWRNLKKN